ncbi:energy transducer TonB, partial [Pseudomonas sp. MF6396]
MPMNQKFDSRRLLKWGVVALVGAGLAWLLWQWANDMSGVRREAPKI